MPREFKSYRVQIFIGTQKVGDSFIEASAPCKAVELFFQDNPHMFIRESYGAIVKVKTDVGIEFVFNITGIKKKE